VTQQHDIVARGREVCSEFPNASFFIAVVKALFTDDETFGEIDSLVPNGFGGWSHFGIGRINHQDGDFDWSLVLVDPSGNNSESTAKDNDG
jgi:hypothetical protein